MDVEFDTFGDFAICAASHTPVYAGAPRVQCPFDAAPCHPRFKGVVCPVCEVCALGAPGSGWRLVV